MFTTEQAVKTIYKDTMFEEYGSHIDCHLKPSRTSIKLKILHKTEGWVVEPFSQVKLQL